MPYKDRNLQLKAQRKCYQKNKKHYINYQQERRIRLKRFLNRYKSLCGCKICNEKHPATLDFHHRDPSVKESTICQLAFGRKFSIARLKNEIRKCIVLCSNCHRKLHYEERNGRQC